MYKKFIVQLFLCNMLLVSIWFCTKGVQNKSFISMTAFQTIFEGDRQQAYPKADKFFRIVKKASSGQRVVDYTIIQKEKKYSLSKQDYDALLKIVQAEAGCEDEMGKMLVAGVVMNRVNDKKFPDTVAEVVLQKEQGVYQFSPVANGTFYTVTVTQETIDAVEKVLHGEDVTQGALYFAAREYADPEKMKWY